MDSVYWWKGEVLDHPETLIVMRSVEGKFKSIEERINELSGYSVLEISALRPDRIGAAFADWVSKGV